MFALQRSFGGRQGLPGGRGPGTSSTGAGPRRMMIGGAVAKKDSALTAILHHIRSLELYAERNGARLVRTTLPECVAGRVFRNLILVRTGQSPEQELLTLVHELTHWLVHRDAASHVLCTLFEYEAEAVEALVMTHLGLRAGLDPRDRNEENPTDGLLSASVTRVVRASRGICAALDLKERRPASEPQTAVDVEATAGKEVVLEYEAHRVSDFVGLSQALQGHRRSELVEHFRAHGGKDLGVGEARRNRADADAVAGQFLGPDHAH